MKFIKQAGIFRASKYFYLLRLIFQLRLIKSFIIGMLNKLPMAAKFLNPVCTCIASAHFGLQTIHHRLAMTFTF